jgi:hypothetical protein
MGLPSNDALRPFDLVSLGKRKANTDPSANKQKSHERDALNNVSVSAVQAVATLRADSLTFSNITLGWGWGHCSSPLAVPGHAQPAGIDQP